jgi:hypothetical protein
VGIFADRQAADWQAAHLSQRGYPAAVSLGKETRWGRFLVHIGPFSSLQEARQVGEQLRREEGLDFWIYKRREQAGVGGRGSGIEG